MGDFDLCQALDGSDLDEMEAELTAFSQTDTQDEVFKLDDGLELVVRHDQSTMKSVANLVLMANRLKKPLTNCGKKLSSDELCSTIIDSLVEETVVIPYRGQAERPYVRSDSRKECTLCDIQQKAVILKSGGLKLQAVTLKGGYDDYKVNFKLAEYRSATHGAGIPVALSIKNSNVHMSCSMKGKKAVLSLEECSKDQLKNINDEDMKRFLFYKRTQGIDLTTFESVKCLGWYITTSFNTENQPVEMCEVDKIESSCRLNVFNMM